MRHRDWLGREDKRDALRQKEDAKEMGRPCTAEDCAGVVRGNTGAWVDGVFCPLCPRCIELLKEGRFGNFDYRLT